MTLGLSEIVLQSRQLSDESYHRAFGLQAVMSYHRAFGLQAVMSYHRAFGLQTVMSYHRAFGLYTVVSYHRAFGLQTVMSYLRAFGLQAVMSYHRAFGLYTVMSYNRAFGLQAVMSYHRAFGLQTVMSYQGVRALHSRELPQGVRDPDSHELPQGVRAPSSHELPQGVRALDSHELPQGVRALHSHELQPGVRAPDGHEFPHSVRVLSGARDQPQGESVGSREVSSLPGTFSGLFRGLQSVAGMAGANHEPTKGARMSSDGGAEGLTSQAQQSPQGYVVGVETARTSSLPQHPQGPPRTYGPEVSADQHTSSGQASAQPQVAGQGAASQATPQQWLGQGTSQVNSGDPLSLLVGGINQLQQAMMKQLDEGGEASPEAVKPGMSVLPTLKAVNPQTAPIDIQDWIEMLNAPMADLSNSSAAWWAEVRQLAMDTYKEWARATPLERLHVKPPVSSELESGKWSRVNARAASMVVQALDPTVSSEMVARQLTKSTPALLFRLLTLYQPGREAEKAWVLQNLQTPEPAQDPMKAVDALRSWGRWMRRSEDINLAKPDPTVLARGLTTIVQPVLDKNYEANFRTSLIRSTLRIDASPTYVNITDYLNHLLAEMESLATGSSCSTTAPMSSQGPTSSTTTGPTSTAAPRVRELRTKGNRDQQHPSRSPTASSSPKGESEEDKSSMRATTPCRYFGRTTRGCTRAAKCPFLHEWKGLDKKDRCLACGGKGHLARECPTKQKGLHHAASTPSLTSASMSPTTSTRSVRIDESRNEVQEPPAVTELGPPAAQAAELKDMLAEAGKVLKALPATHLKSLQLDISLNGSDIFEKIEQFQEEIKTGGLLDSGASNPLRTATKGEIATSSQVTVTLAGEDTKVLNQTLLGTIVVPESTTSVVQPIVLLGALIHDLGCKLSWTKRSLKLVHPIHGALKVAIRNKCPEVAVSDALTLIRELELKELERLNLQVKAMSAKLEMIQEKETRAWDELIRDYVKTGSRETLWKALTICPFTKNLPAEVMELACEGVDHDQGLNYLKELPLTRRQRRRLMASNAWVVHLFAGESSGPGDPLRLVEKHGKVLLEIDVMNSRLWDLRRPHGAFQLLLWAAANKKIDDVLGGPPCRTYSALLHRPKEGYPSPARSSEFPHGVPGLEPRRQAVVHGDTALAVKQLLIWTVAFFARNQTFVGFFMEHPRDPATFLKTKADEPIQDYPSMWRMEFWENFRSLFDMTMVTYDQGAMGHLAKKPTTSGTNYKGLMSLDGMVATSIGLTSATALASCQLSRWAVGLRRRLAEAGGRQVDKSVEELDAVISKKLSPGEREQWQRHLENDHQPYRPDCSVCLNARGTGKPHRRVLRPTAFSLALDTAGPFKHRGRDLDHADYRYLLVGAYRFLKGFLQEQQAEELKEAIHVPDDDGDLPDELLLDEPESPKVLKETDEWEDGPVEVPEDDGDPPGVEKEVAEDPGEPGFDKLVETLKSPVEATKNGASYFGCYSGIVAVAKGWTSGSKRSF